MRRRAMIAVATVGLALGGCAASPKFDCEAGERAAVVDTVYFGSTRPQGVVTSAEWAAFLRSVVTPRFPRGLTWWDAAGQWRAVDGSMLHEAAHVLQVVHPPSAEDDAAMRAIVGDYKARFQQEAVLRVRAPGCLSF